MTIIARMLGSLTVMLCIALMGVAAYAAKTQAQESNPAPAPSSATPQSEATPGPLATPTPASGAPHPSIWADLGDEATAPFVQEAIRLIWERGAAHSPNGQVQPELTEPTPKFVAHYAAPSEAGRTSGGVVGRGDLSAGPHVWRVTSIRPVPAYARGAAGGLEVPPDQLVVMQQVSAITGIPWQILAGIAKVESDFGRNMSTSWAGAIGYGQFMPAEWARYGNGGDPYDYRDVLPAMAHYLLVAGAPQDIPDAIYAYNHDWGYVANVLSYATAYTLPPSANGQLSWPAIGPISTYFSQYHQGIDIDQTMKVGSPVLAAHDGIVLFAGGDACCSYGLYVILVSPSGLETLYAHFSSLGVAVGQSVHRGQPLGVVGSTGHSTGTHVHFEVIQNGVRVNPLDFLPPVTG